MAQTASSAWQKGRRGRHPIEMASYALDPAAAAAQSTAATASPEAADTETETETAKPARAAEVPHAE
jgi:hypothetical protein